MSNATRNVHGPEPVANKEVISGWGRFFQDF
jgi:hypothetical protein